MPYKYIGQPIKRVEDHRFLTGRGKYVDDLRVLELAHVAILRSLHAHARIRAIDARPALQVPGVLAVFTGEDTRGLGNFPVVNLEHDPLVPFQPVLADDRVRFVGELVAAVVALSPAVARDALDRIEVEYEPLPAVVDLEAALDPDAPLVHEDVPGNVCMRHSQRAGAVDAAFARAAHVVRVRIQTNRVAHVAMEPRGVIADYDQGRGELTVWSATQAPFRVRTALSEVLGIPENRIRVIAPDVGGGFGGKSVAKSEEALLGFIALHLRRPVKWISTRSEDLVSTHHGRGILHLAEAAADEDGRVLALRVRLVHTPGAYVAATGLLPAIRSSQFSTGPYRIPAIERETLCVLTNTNLMGPNRGTGRPESIAMIERVIEEVALATELDPLEVRRRNLIRPDEFPYCTPTGTVYDSGDYQHTLARMLELADYEGLRRQQEQARARGELVGLGLCTSVGMTATQKWQSATVQVERSGDATVFTGSSPHGQGHETVWAQVAADYLGMRMEDIRVVHGDTAATPPGTGTMGTNGAPLSAPAVALASRQVQEKMLRIAAHAFECQPEDLAIEAGRVQVRGVPERSISVKQIAQLAYAGRGLPPGMEPGLDATVRFMHETEPFAFGAFLVATRVDRETGEVRVEKIVGVDDCGVVLNPLILDGQSDGGVAFGLGQVLYEQIVYDEAGQPLTTSFLDYAIPRADAMPAELVLDRTVTPSPLNPLGTKGGAEGANIALPAAVYNSVLDALRPLGVRTLPMPLTPQNVWRAMQAAQRG
ncbi:MAG: xanthine dehydrogenase family protein molybdopterin-binding subunit [Chloroflexi bacterium]|nr:xanthine dehydrogenase family protein molybdopterin-binding subunit [Chloroflexota bacterium]